jgi:hypothetical protein
VLREFFTGSEEQQVVVRVVGASSLKCIHSCSEGIQLRPARRVVLAAQQTAVLEGIAEGVHDLLEEQREGMKNDLVDQVKSSRH